MTEETKKAEATAQTAEAKTAPAPEAPVELTVQDLGNIKQIRGAPGLQQMIFFLHQALNP